MQFADPDWSPTASQEEYGRQGMPPLLPEGASLSSSPSASQVGTTQQTAGTEHDYAQGYRNQTSQAPEHEEMPRQAPGQQPFTSTQNQPWYQRVPIWAWILIGFAVFGGPFFSPGRGVAGSIFSLVVVALIALVAWLLITRRVTVNASGERLQPETHTFTVGAQPTIIIDSKAGSIRLHTGEEGEVKVVTTKRGYVFSPQWNRDAQIWYNQDNGKNTISARVDSWKFFGKNAVDFDITVPAQANLQLTANAGNILVENVVGQMVLKADAGTIRASQVTLEGRSRLKTNLGTIHFNGSLSPSGDYEMATDLGSVNARLPVNASFNLDAKTDLGSVNTNLPLSRIKRDKASGQVGNGPAYPRLRLKTDLGSVSVYRQ